MNVETCVLRALLIIVASGAVSITANAESGTGEADAPYLILRAYADWWGQKPVAQAEAELQTTVASYIAKGYQPIGGVSVVSGDKANTVVSQAVVLTSQRRSLQAK